MLEVRSLTCVRGDRILFQGLGFKVEPGAAAHIVGANGAGKTSLLRLLCGLSSPEAGEVLWNGETIRSLREEYFRQLVYIGHASAVKDDLTAVENLMTSTEVGGLDIEEADAREALERIGLAGREDLPARVLSQGQRRRVVLARLMLAVRTPLWILDEPFNALDRRAVDQLRQTAEGHLQRGGLLVFTTHQEVPLRAAAIQRVDLDEVAR